MSLFNNIYNGKRVFITGHTGFKGSWLSLWLKSLGAEVIGYSKDIPTKPNHFDLLRINMRSIVGDILDLKKLQKEMGEFQPDIVFHLAAQALVRESYCNPIETFATNVLGTAHVLEACRYVKSVRAIVNVTSDKCYHNREWERGYTEDDHLGGYDPYSASKGCAEIVGNSYRNSFFNVQEYGRSHHLLLADARAGNVIGGGDWAADRLIPDVMRATSRGETVVVHNPQSTRPWQHVLEPISGYLHLGWKLLAGEKEFADNWNFGPEDEASLTVQEVVDQIKKYWDKISYNIKPSEQNIHEAVLLKLDSTNARVKLRWRSVWDSSTAFEKAITWYKNYYQDGIIGSEKDLVDYINDATKSLVAWTNSKSDV